MTCLTVSSEYRHGQTDRWISFYTTVRSKNSILQINLLNRLMPVEQVDDTLVYTTLSCSCQFPFLYPGIALPVPNCLETLRYYLETHRDWSGQFWTIHLDRGVLVPKCPGTEMSCYLQHHAFSRKCLGAKISQFRCICNSVQLHRPHTPSMDSKVQQHI